MVIWKKESETVTDGENEKEYSAEKNTLMLKPERTTGWLVLPADTLLSSRIPVVGLLQRADAENTEIDANIVVYSLDKLSSGALAPAIEAI